MHRARLLAAAALFTSVLKTSRSTRFSDQSDFLIVFSTQVLLKHYYYVDECLRRLEATESDIRIQGGAHNDGRLFQKDTKTSPKKKIYIKENDDRDRRKTMDHQMKFGMNGYAPPNESTYRSDCEKRRDVTDFTLHNDSSFSSFDTEKFMTDFKPWTPSINELSDSKINISEQRIYEETDKLLGIQQKEIVQPLKEIETHEYIPSNTDFTLINQNENPPQYIDASYISKIADEFMKSQSIISTPGIHQDTLPESNKSAVNISKSSVVPTPNPLEALVKNPEIPSLNATSDSKFHEKNSVGIVNNNEPQNLRPQRLLTLSDFWTQDSSKSHEEQLRIKLEEERFRREHCEQLIQELQKKLLEQQEKIAVAIRVDNEKNTLINQFQESWKKMKQRLYELESERENLQKVLKSISEKHQSEINDCQIQNKKYKEELSKALNLATGYKEKSDSLVKEKVDLLKSHADELQSYKSLVQQAESRYEEMKAECQKLLKKNQETDEALKAVQQDLNKELLKGGEVRTEMAVIHKALDSCEAELTILRQEKENLQLKLKEEVNRNNILEQGKGNLLTAINEAKEAERLAKNEVKSLTEHQEKLRAELRDVYQKQVDEVVKTKLQEFQTQLDSAETLFQSEIETNKRAIAECAARKIKGVIDKHQLEINLIEEKHKEEKKLFEIKAAQAVQKATLLEAQLNSYRKTKNNLVEQLHTMMQKQWQQALLIISGGNLENLPSLQQVNVDKLFDCPNNLNLELVPKHSSTLCSEPMRLESQKSTTSLPNVPTQENQNESLVTLASHDETPLTSRKESKNDLKKYIKMILDMQQVKEDHPKLKFFSGSPPSSQKENSGKQTLQKDADTSNEANSSWQPVSEISVHDTSEYLSIPQKLGQKSYQHQQKQKPPWK